MSNVFPVDAPRATPLPQRSRRARAKFIRGGLLCLAALIGFLGVTVWRRNATNVAQVESRLRQRFVVPLQNRIDRLGGTLPLEFPSGADPAAARGRGYHYPDAEDAWVLRRSEEPVLVGHTGRMALFFRPDGYFAVVFHQGRLWVEWMLESDFYRRVGAQQEWVQGQHQVYEALRHKAPQLP